MKKLLTSLLVLIFLAGTLSAQKAGNEKIFKDSQIKKTMKKALAWQLKNPKHKLYDWTNGAFYAGVFAAYETTGSKKIWKAMYRSTCRSIACSKQFNLQIKEVMENEINVV